MPGQLTQLSPATVATGSLPNWAAVTPDGLNLYTANFSGGTIGQYSISSGFLAPLSPSAVATGGNPHAVIVHPNGLFAYAAVYPSTIAQYAIVAGALVPLFPFLVSGLVSPSQMAISGDGAFLFVTNNASTFGLIYSYSIGVGGQLTLVNTIATLPSGGSAPVGIGVTPNGLNLYVANAAGNTISQFSVSSGVMTRLSPATVISVTNPEILVVSNEGKNLYVTGLTGVSQFSIGVGGALAALSPPSVATSSSPGGLAISPNSRNIYVANDNNTLSQFARDPITGLLTPLSPATVSSTVPACVTMHPTGLFAYSVEILSDVVRQYSVSLNTVVPDVVGLALAAANSAVFAADLASSVTTASSLTVAAGLIISQSPAAGTTVLAGSTVDLVESTGADPIPNVIGFAVSTARADIIGAGFALGTFTGRSDLVVPVGAILEQNPIGGTLALSGAQVDLIQSLGAATVPDVVGDSLALANSLIEGAQLSVGETHTAVSSTVAYGNIISQAPAAGALALFGSPVVLTFSVPGSNFDVDDTVISQYANSPTLLRVIHNMAEYLPASVNFATFYQHVWNIDSASGFGLDIWGRIVGVSRLLRIVNTSQTFGFHNDSIPSDWQPFNQGSFNSGATASQAYKLPDGTYRTLILTKALANIVATNASSLNRLLRNLFPGRGRCYVLDLGGMAMRFVFEFQLSLAEYSILTQSGVLPHPAGVSFSVTVIAPTDTFGFSEQGGTAQPFDQGVFFSPVST